MALSMTTYEEAEIVQMLKDPQRRHQAFEQLVHLYSPQLYRQIRRMVYCHEDANDILQNSFLKAWSHLDFFRGDAKISTWLYRIALNETLNFIQKKKESVALDDTSASIINRLEADEYFDGDQTELQLQQAMSLLPEKQRMVFQLKYYEEMKYEQMSEILGTSIGALKASYHHAVKKIYDFFNSCD